MPPRARPCELHRRPSSERTDRHRYSPAAGPRPASAAGLLHVGGDAGRLMCGGSTPARAARGRAGMNALIDGLTSSFLPKFHRHVEEFRDCGHRPRRRPGARPAAGAGTLQEAGGGVVGGTTASLVAMLRAAPTFVVMFFLLNAIARRYLVRRAFRCRVMIVAVAGATRLLHLRCGPRAMRHLRGGTTQGALLFLPNVTRASSCWSCRRVRVRDRRHRGHHRHPAPGQPRPATGWSCCHRYRHVRHSAAARLCAHQLHQRRLGRAAPPTEAEARPSAC